MENSIFSLGNFCCQYSDDDFGFIEEDDKQRFEVDALRGEDSVFLMQEPEPEELKILVTLDAENKAQARLIEKLILENRDLKKLLQILEEREYAFKKETYNMRRENMHARKNEDEIENQLKNQICHCKKLKTEIEERRSSLKGANEATVEKLKA